MSATPQSQPTIKAFCGEHHVINWNIKVQDPDLHTGCTVGKFCVVGKDQSCPMANLFAAYQQSGLWDACDPKHRACYIGQPCMVTGEKTCPRILYVAKYQHAYGNCSSSGPDHAFCPAISELEQQCLFPSCSACVVLTEARGLVLIHRRILDECVEDENFSAADIDCIKKSVSGYIRAFHVRRNLHLEELQRECQMVYDMEMSYASGNDDTSTVLNFAAGRTRWWKVTIGKVVNTIIRILS
ncbi:hypothetical protein CORC01_09624 [Colletotrichum orchidophilum]|uniref:Uncharacterized protein n=1 Tax=Colletotrichum orchidophilum TaxID=1209926 RepID=A0A1G4B100_9PEZI|nr:uncharacterized protein CORC01_09624 [Colletotrichum orchidophilum]OHE95100.1 hypothetical protein CORC01_09624 [Colletotrichum orchidophilum]